MTPARLVVALVLAPGCALVAGLGKEYSGAPDAAGADTGDATSDAPGLGPDGQVAETGTGTEGGTTFSCPTGPDVLACSDLTTKWPYNGGCDGNFNIDTQGLHCAAAASTACLCTKDYTPAVAITALQYEVEFMLVTRPPGTYVELGQLQFAGDGGARYLTFYIDGSGYGLTNSFQTPSNISGLGSPATGKWIPLTIEWVAGQPGKVTLNGQVVTTFTIDEAALLLRFIEVGESWTNDGSIRVAFRNVLVKGH